MGYTTKEGMVRVDIFRLSGKWYTTEVVCMHGQYAMPCIHEAFKDACDKAFGNRFEGLSAVCIEPYHKNAHPVMIKEL